MECEYFYGSDWIKFCLTRSSNRWPGGGQLKAKLGVGLGFNENDITVTLGLQAGVKYTRLSTNVEQSISLTDDEAKHVSEVSEGSGNAPWIINKDEIFEDENGGYWTRLYTRTLDKGPIFQGDEVNTGILLYSGQRTDENENTTSNGVWQTASYEIAAKKAEKE